MKKLLSVDAVGAGLRRLVCARIDWSLCYYSACLHVIWLNVISWCRVAMTSMCMQVVLTGVYVVFVKCACLHVIRACCCRRFRAVCIGRRTSTFSNPSGSLDFTFSLVFVHASNSLSPLLGFVYTSSFQPTCRDALFHELQ